MRALYRVVVRRWGLILHRYASTTARLGSGAINTHISPLTSRSKFGPDDLKSRQIVTNPATSNDSEKASLGIVARKYQQDCVSAVLRAFEANLRPAVSLPTGSGKTVVFCMLLPLVKPARLDHGQKVLIVVPRREIAQQTVAKIHGLYPGRYRVGLEMGKSHFDPATDDVCVATFQSLSRKERLEKLDPRNFRLVIVDEAHRSAADSIQTILDHMGVLQPKPPVHLVGFSATFWRNDDRSLGETFDEVVYHEALTSMIDSGHLCKVRLSNVTGAFGHGLLSSEQRKMGPHHVLRTPEGLQVIVDLYKDSWPNYHSTVVFCMDIEHMRQVTASFRQEGIDARGIHGTMASAERDDILNRFGAGEFPVLTNCAVLVEGTDIPRIDQVILARSLSSELMAVQMVGRAMRQYPGKHECHVVQFRELSRYKGNTDLLPLLSSLNLDLEVDNRSPDTSRARSASAIASTTTTGEVIPVTRSTLEIHETSFTPEQMFGDYDNYKPHTPLQSALAWVRPSNTSKSYYLFPPGGERPDYLRVSRKPVSRDHNKDTSEIGGVWQLHQVIPLPHKRVSNIKLKFESRDLTETSRTADSLAQKAWPRHVVNNCFVRTEWLHRPPTAKQAEFLRKCGVSEDRIEREVTRGIAWAIICLRRIGFKIKPDLVTSVADQIGRGYKPHPK